MPHLDDEAPAAALGDREIFCRTLPVAEINRESDDDVGDDKSIHREHGGDMLEHLPPESFLISLDEFKLFNGNAFINRKESYKGNAAPNSARPNHSTRQLPRFDKSKVSLMISLPKSQNFVDASSTRSCNCKHESSRLFQKSRELSTSSKSSNSSSAAEPTSPKVSCMGRVRSKRRRLKSDQKLKAVGWEIWKEKSPEKKQTGLLSSFRAVFGSHGGKARGKLPEPSLEAEIVQMSTDARSPDRNIHETSPNSRSPATEPGAARPCIMERFVSSRRLELLP